MNERIKELAEQAGWMMSDEVEGFNIRLEKFAELLVQECTAPPKREWVGLTDEEIYDYADKFLYQHGSNYGIRSFGKAIEAKLKEKNGG